jgi:hypothetical protein
MRTGHAPWRKETKMTDVSCIKFNLLSLKGSTTDTGLSKKKYFSTLVVVGKGNKWAGSILFHSQLITLSCT